MRLIKYLLKISFYLFFLHFFSFAFISCASTSKIEPIDESKMTFVNTVFSEDGKLYTSCIFSSIYSVSKKTITGKNDYSDLDKNKGSQISSKYFSYNIETGELVLNRETDKKENTMFHIKGVYENPPKFALAGNICEYPLVLFEGKRLVRNKDYKFDSNISLITMNEEVDLNTASYSIHWYTMNRECVFENEYDKYEAEYTKFVNDWYKELE